VVVHFVNELVARLRMSLPREDVHVVPAPLQGRGQLGDMNTHAADGDGMKRLPRKQGYTHRTNLLIYRR
jgi:hypothetical protein